MQRHDVASTLSRRCINVICLLGTYLLAVRIQQQHCQCIQSQSMKYILKGMTIQSNANTRKTSKSRQYQAVWAGPASFDQLGLIIDPHEF